jgi:hypothetical protein
MASDVLGKLKTIRPVWWVGIAGVGGFVGWRYLSARQAAAASANAVQIDPATGLPIDPSTGLDVGSGGTIGDAYQNPAPAGAANTGDTSSTTAPTTDQEWTQAGVTFMAGLGYDAQTVLAAESLYLADQGVTTDQATLLHEVIAGIGRNPGTPHSIRTVTAPPPTTTPPVTTTNAVNPVKGVKVLSTNLSTSTMSVAWSPAAHATGYTVSIGTNTAGSNHQTLTAPAYATQLTFGSLQPKTRYYLRVQANPAASGAPWSAVVSGTTK